MSGTIKLEFRFSGAVVEDNIRMLETSSMSIVQQDVYRVWCEFTAKVPPEVGHIVESIEPLDREDGGAHVVLKLTPVLPDRCPLEIDMLSGPHDGVNICYAHLQEVEMSVYGWYSDNPSEFAEITASIIASVIRGEVVETIWRTRWGAIARSVTEFPKNSIFSGGSDSRPSWLGLILGATKERIEYKPYY